MLAYYLLGFVLGAGSSVVPGPCGLTIIDAATRLGRARAVATAIGAGFGDLTYGALGVLAIGHLVARNQELVAILLAINGLVLIGYGIAFLRRRPAVQATTPTLGGIVVGFVTVLCNPSALVLWSAVGIQLVGASPLERVAAVLGIGAGAMAWFAGLAYVSARGHERFGARMHRVVDVIGALIVAYGAVTLARAFL